MPQHHNMPLSTTTAWQTDSSSLSLWWPDRGWDPILCPNSFFADEMRSDRTGDKKKITIIWKKKQWGAKASTWQIGLGFEHRCIRRRRVYSRAWSEAFPPTSVFPTTILSCVSVRGIIWIEYGTIRALVERSKIWSNCWISYESFDIYISNYWKIEVTYSIPGTLCRKI